MDPPAFLLSGPDGPPRLLLAHGAGAGMDSPLLEALADGLAAAGVRTARFEFPYMRKARAEGRRRPPDRMERLEEAYRGAVAALGGAGDLVIGGVSMGGRVASRVADGLGARALVCVSYPFHPPGRPEKLRTAHLAGLRTPALFVQGARDPFGTAAEARTFGLARTVRFHEVADGDHALAPRKSSGRTAAEARAEAAAAVARFVAAAFARAR